MCVVRDHLIGSRDYFIVYDNLELFVPVVGFFSHGLSSINLLIASGGGQCIIILPSKNCSSVF